MTDDKVKARLRPITVTILFPQDMPVGPDRAQWYIEGAIRGWWQNFATESDPIRKMRGAVVTFPASPDALQAERDKLSAELEAADERAHSAEARSGRNLARADAAEAKLTALVEAGRSILIDYTFLAAKWGHEFDEAEREKVQALRQALAHHSAPVGSSAMPPIGSDAYRALAEKAAKDAGERLASAPPTTPTSAPVEDVGTVEKIARIIDPHAWALYREKDKRHLYVDAVAGRKRVRANSLAKAEAILAALSPSLIQPRGEERS